MQVILMERVAKLGQMGDVVTVKQGYARNYLLPLKKAMRATEANIAVFEKQKSQMEARNLEAKSEADAIAVSVDTICVHGDNSAAIKLAETVRTKLEKAGIEVGSS